MKSAFAITLTALACGILGGCAGLEAQLEGKPVGKREQPAVGLTYFLPAKLLEVEAAFTITDCDATDADGELPKLGYTTKLTLNEVIVADRNQAYTIDYEQLNALTKVTNTTFTVLPNGTLGALNTAVADHTGAVIGNVVSTGFNIARAAFFPGSDTFVTMLKGAGAASGRLPLTTKSMNNLTEKLAKPVSSACHPKLIEALEKVQQLKTQLEVENKKDKERAQAKAALDKAQSDIDAARATYRQLPKQHTPAEQAELLAKEKQAIAERAASEKLLEKMGESASAKVLVALNKAVDGLTYVVKASWLPSESNLGAVTLPVGQDVLARLYNKETATKVTASCIDRMSNSCVDSYPGISLQLVDLGGASPAPAAENPPAKPRTDTGIWYRRPVHFRVVACRGECVIKAGDNIVVGDRVIHQKLVSMPQLGVTGLLTLNNHIFDDNSIEVAFDADGAVSRLVFTSKARAEAASAAAAENSAKLLDFLKQGAAERRGETKAQREDNVADLSTRLDAVKKLGEIEQARAGLHSNHDAEIQRIKNETEKLGAQLELERKRREFEQFKAGEKE